MIYISDNINDNKLILDLDLSIINKDFKEFSLEKLKIINKYIINLRNQLNDNNKLNDSVNNIMGDKDIKDFYLKDILNTLIKAKDISSLFLYTFFLIVTYDNMINEEDDKMELKTKISTIKVLIN